MIILEKILGALTGKENLYRCGRNFTAIEQALNNVSGEAADIVYDNTTSGMTATDVQAAVDELRAQNNSLATQTYKDLGFLSEGTLSAFILSKVNQGQTKGTFYYIQLSDAPASMPSVANVRYSSNTTLTNTIYVELFTGLDIYVNTLNASNGVWSAWTKLQKDTSILYLYSLGNECIDVTGGWEGITTKGTVETIKNTDNLYVHSAAPASDGMFATANLIDLTEYSTINFEYVGNPTGGWVSFRAGLSKSVNCLAENNAGGIYPVLASAKTTVSFDISALNGSYYIKIGTGSGDSSVPYFNVYTIRLEK